MTPQGSAARRPDLKARLIAAARQILERDGLEALSLRATARAVGVSHMAPYRHFSDKDALLAAVATEGFVALSECIAAEMAERGATKSGAVAYVSFALENPALYRLMFSGDLAPFDRYPELVAAGRAAFQYCLDAAAVFTRRGEGDARRAAVGLWSLIHGLAGLGIDGLIDLSGPRPSREAEILAILAATPHPE